jgi:hypothetical protein
MRLVRKPRRFSMIDVRMGLAITAPRCRQGGSPALWKRHFFPPAAVFFSAWLISPYALPGRQCDSI